MRRHRTTARAASAAALLILLVAAALATPASGRQETVPRLVFPLVAKAELWDNWGDPRPQGSHEGIDIAAERRAPLVAVEPGRVEYATSRLGGCMLYLYGQSGTMYLYIHLNNDVSLDNDNRGGCKLGIGYAVRDGARVVAGEHIGMTGDSGDQDGNPGLHFEVHPNGGEDVNPYRHLKRAVKSLFAGRPGAVFSLGLRGRLTAAGAAAATMTVEEVRVYPGGRWTEIDPRDVELVVPRGAAFAGRLNQLTQSSFRALKAPIPVAAFTLKAKTTTGAMLGAPGELVLGSVTSSR